MPHTRAMFGGLALNVAAGLPPAKTVVVTGGVLDTRSEPIIGALVEVRPASGRFNSPVVAGSRDAPGAWRTAVARTDSDSLVSPTPQYICP